MQAGGGTTHEPQGTAQAGQNGGQRGAAGQSAVFPATTTALERQFNDSVAHFQAGRLKEAEAGLSEFQRLQPDIPEVLHLMALIERQTGRPEAAAGHLEKAGARQPESADLHNLLGG
ncbi:MAG: hypothetical protein MK294_08175, partial [Rhodospirillales bacterium]|nr:hypothetical protein [Rhodospirillales bacterium]